VYKRLGWRSQLSYQGCSKGRHHFIFSMAPRNTLYGIGDTGGDPQAGNSEKVVGKRLLVSERAAIVKVKVKRRIVRVVFIFLWWIMVWW
jgi:hypothetical protein